MIVFRYRKTIHSFQTVKAALEGLKSLGVGKEDVELFEGSFEKVGPKPKFLATNEEVEKKDGK